MQDPILKHLALIFWVVYTAIVSFENIGDLAQLDILAIEVIMMHSMATRQTYVTGSAIINVITEARSRLQSTTNAPITTFNPGKEEQRSPMVQEK